MASLTSYAFSLSNWAEPHPARREALLDGRDFDYNRQAFLNRLSYRYLLTHPRSGEDGFRGTGGSVSSTEMFTDIFFQQTLTGDDGQNQILLRFHRFEDFDGYDDRMEVGLGRYVRPFWRLAVVGDVHANKEKTDIYLESRLEEGDNRLLRLAYIMPDNYYNAKVKDDNLRYARKPETWFLHYRENHAPGWIAEIAVNLSPRSRFVDSYRGINASGKQTRLMGGGSVPVNNWLLRLSYAEEWADRDFVFDQAKPPPLAYFKRSMRELVFELHSDAINWAPRLGMRHLHLNEDGWFGANSNRSGSINRREITAFAGITIPVTENSCFEPIIYAGPAYIRHHFIDDTHKNRHEDGLIGKLTVPWRHTFNRESGANLTVSLSTHLHKSSFGGGAIQVQWPL